MTKLPTTGVPAGGQDAVREWLATPQIAAEMLADQLKFTLVLLDQYEPGVDRILAERAELGELSWLGGPAIAPLAQWPRTVDGEPLAHIATIFLPEAQALLDSDDPTGPNWPEASARLPGSGYLEVFHHLGTYGEPGDDQTGGWLVRHVPFDGEHFPTLVHPPEDLDVPHEVCQPVLLGASFSLPRAVEFVEADDAVFAAAERVEEELYATWQAWREAKDSASEPVFPTSHIYGHSDAGSSYAVEVLQEVRPLTSPQDSYVLVLSIESWTHFNGWFGDAANFEVWMRASDLAAGDFDQAWCMIRTDH